MMKNLLLIKKRVFIKLQFVYVNSYVCMYLLLGIITSISLYYAPVQSMPVNTNFIFLINW